MTKTRKRKLAFETVLICCFRYGLHGALLLKNNNCAVLSDRDQTTVFTMSGLYPATANVWTYLNLRRPARPFVVSSSGNRSKGGVPSVEQYL